LAPQKVASKFIQVGPKVQRHTKDAKKLKDMLGPGFKSRPGHFISPPQSQNHKFPSSLRYSKDTVQESLKGKKKFRS